jgi:hypothetical protein
MDRKRTRAAIISANAAANLSRSRSPARSTAWRVPLLCKTSLGGSGFALLTLSNLTTKTIPKGQTLFAKKGNETIKFEAAEDIRENGSSTYRTSAAAFQDGGDCLGWY